MTQEELVNLVMIQNVKIEALEEKLNRLLTDKNSDSSSNEQRSISSQRLGSEPNEFNNSQLSTNKNINSGGTINNTSSVSNSNNMGGCGGLTTSNSDLNNKNQPQLILNEEETFYRSINELDNNSRSDSPPIMLFDQSNKIVDNRSIPLLNNSIDSMNLKQSGSLNSQRATKSDESNNSWKSNFNLNEREENKENNSLKQQQQQHQNGVEKRIINNLNKNHNEDDDSDEDDEEEEDEDKMELFNTALKYIKTLDLNDGQQQHGLNSYYMIDSQFLPKLQYISMYMEDTGDKNLSMEASSLAMKYLEDEKLTKVARGISKAAKRHQKQKQISDTYLNIDNDEAISMYDENNYSMASKQYLERHGMSSTKKTFKPSFDRSLSTPVNKTEKNRLKNKREEVEEEEEEEEEGDDDDKIWIFGKPNSKSNDSYNTSAGSANKNNYQNENNQKKMQFQQKYNKKNEEKVAPKNQQFIKDKYNFKVFDNDDDSTTRILDVDQLKQLPKFM